MVRRPSKTGESAEAFVQMKKDVLSRKDKSRIGQVDRPIAPLIRLINASPDYCTVSSCSGRIQLLAKPSSRKHLAAWAYKTHDLAKEEEVIEAAMKPFKGELWFRQEGFILHVRCRTETHAFALLDAAQRAGFKHSGITGKRNRVLEIRCSDTFDTIIGRGGQLIVERLYLRILTEVANEKMEENAKRIDLFEINVHQLFDAKRKKKEREEKKGGECLTFTS